MPLRDVSEWPMSQSIKEDDWLGSRRELEKQENYWKSGG